MNADILRQKYLDFFKSKKHKIVESDSLVPKDDPTVLFTPAGMNQFKKQFLGMVGDFRRATTSQRCMRTDDLDKVGHTAVHHTFFEMLGNFSFGDYFKKEAIAWAWEFLTEELKISPEKLWVSVYKDDDEAFAIWRDDIKVPAQKILKLGDKDNFWPAEAKQKGPNGPCGPCSEIFFDFGKETGCGEPACDPTCSCGRFAEIWNLVFTQFNRKEGGALEPLPQKNIDTGMGLERLCAVMQGKKNNFDTDLFAPIIAEIKAHAQAHPACEKELLCAVADHIRAVVFSIFDGVMPSNEGRGYVVRKIIRKSLLHLKALEVKAPFLYTLVPVVAKLMHAPNPELAGRRENIAAVILAEEKNFITVLDSSRALLEENFAPGKAYSSSQAAKIVFKLYDTHGIPVELAKDWLDARKIVFAQSDLDKEMALQKERSKQLSAMKGDVFSLKELDLKVKATSFVGYARLKTPAKILKIIKDAKEAKKVTAGDQAEIILDKSVFYAESGGQAGDCGTLIKGKNIFEVTDTKKAGKIFLHCGVVKQGSFKLLDALTAQLDAERRLAIGRNHTATHLLQAALRKVLGAHVQQQGSMVAAQRLRFDFTHFKGVTLDELGRIEGEVNRRIIENHSLSVKEMPLAQAKKSGALAFFAEKYEGTVRVVQVSDFSKEFCGGTHLESTGQIGVFKIIHEGSVASGIRRIEAVTGTYAFERIRQEEGVLSEACRMLNVPVEKLAAEIEKKLGLVKELEKKLSAKKLDTAKASLDSLLQNAEERNGIKIIAHTLEGLDMGLLRNNVDFLRQKAVAAVIALGSSVDGKAMLVVGLTQDLAARGMDATKIIALIAPAIGGSGGGRKDFAQAGGCQPENFQKAFAQLKDIIGQGT